MIPLIANGNDGIYRHRAPEHEGQNMSNEQSLIDGL